MASAERLAQVAVGRPVRGAFTYSVPDALADKLQPGMRISVPFGRGRALGFYLGPADVAPPMAPKPILELLDAEPALTPEVLKLATWAAEYYRFPLGEALRGTLPPGLTDLRPPPEMRTREVTWVEPLPRVAEAEPALRGALMRAVLSYLDACGRCEIEELSGAVPGARDAVKRLAARGLVRMTVEASEGARGQPALAGESPLQLSSDQARALTKITAALDAGGFAPFLLHGVTGSGKTEVYLRAIAHVRARGAAALCLVPEIGLTPQLVGRFRARFGDAVAVLHSGLKDGERLAEWRRLRSGEAPVAVGVRSAIFAPLPNLGLVLVDEEHDPSFKQEEKLRYHARDLAVLRAQQAGCPVVLGSATPSLETLENARRGRYRLLSLPVRIDDRPMPRVEVVDLRVANVAPPSERHEPRLLSPALTTALAETLDRGEQAILFLNRRGHSTFVTCTTCGKTLGCPNCAISLTHHLQRRGMLCHYCGYHRPLPQHCPECRGTLARLGMGTEKVEEEVARDFPSARIARLDRDSAGDTAELTRTLADFARGASNVMIGTQMVAKGHDFPGVTLVGVVLADTALALPDFRAAERTFQVLAQVAGRAGRGKQAGRVLVQTYNPESDAVARVVGHDFDGFAQAELLRREALGFPPYARLLALRIDGMHERNTADGAKLLADAAERAIRAGREPLRLLGPAPAPISRLRGRTRWQLLVKGRSHGAMAHVIQALDAAFERLPPGVHASFDVDPVNLL